MVNVFLTLGSVLFDIMWWCLVVCGCLVLWCLVWCCLVYFVLVGIRAFGVCVVMAVVVGLVMFVFVPVVVALWDTLLLL